MTTLASATEISSAAIEASFYIPATNLPARPHRTLKHNDTFAYFDSHGDIGATSGGNDGLFHCDTRYLSHLELLINGAQPLLLGSAIKDDNLNYYVDLTNPDIYVDEQIVFAEGYRPYRPDHLSLRGFAARADRPHQSRSRRLCSLVSPSFSPATSPISSKCAVFAATVADRAWSEAARQPGTVALSYAGLDEVVRETTLSFEPAPTALLDSVATYACSWHRGPRHAVRHCLQHAR